MALLPGSSLSVDTFDRLKPLEHLLRFIPTGSEKEGKKPLIREWTKHPGFTVQELQEQFPQAMSVGVVTQPLLCFDFDGETATQHAVLNNRDPDTSTPASTGLLILTATSCCSCPAKSSWRSFLTVRSLTALRRGQLAAFVTLTKRCCCRQGEAEEIFCHPGRQVIVAGAHPSSGGHYFWPVGFGPEALSAPPEEWWDHVLKLSRDYPHPAAGANKTVSTSRFASRDWQRIEHCPICGRGPDDNPLCQLHRDGETLRCFLGQTFSPPTNLEPGELVPGTDWAFSRVSSSGWGEFLTFVKDKPNRYQQIKSMLRGRING